jgi:hypothetical protein
MNFLIPPSLIPSLIVLLMLLMMMLQVSGCPGGLPLSHCG